MGGAEVDILAKSLVRLLSDMISLYGELAALMRNKLEAIRRAESDLVQSITAREMMLVGRLGERDGLRRQITRKLLKALGEDAEKLQNIRLTELAEHLSEPRRSQLLVSAAGLKERAEEIERMRVTTALITQEMLKHMEAVFSVMTSSNEPDDVYSRTGIRERGGSANVFEAVG